METNKFIKLSESQIDKLGNTLIYLMENVTDVSKTKLLKLVYILDEFSIKKSGIPFLNLGYKVWQFGPVSEELFIELSDEPILLNGYIQNNENGSFEAVKPFSDDEFSDNDLELLDEVIMNFGSRTAKELVNYTHRKNTPWHITAEKSGVLSLLENREITNTEIMVDMKSLVAFDERKSKLYSDFQQQ